MDQWINQSLSRYKVYFINCKSILSSPDQVEKFQCLMGNNNLGTVHADSWGLKRLFSHGYRRWCSGAQKPRVSLDLAKRIFMYFWIIFYMCFSRCCFPKTGHPQSITVLYHFFVYHNLRTQFSTAFGRFLTMRGPWIPLSRTCHPMMMMMTMMLDLLLGPVVALVLWLLRMVLWGVTPIHCHPLLPHLLLMIPMLQFLRPLRKPTQFLLRKPTQVLRTQLLLRKPTLYQEAVCQNLLLPRLPLCLLKVKIWNAHLSKRCVPKPKWSVQSLKSWGLAGVIFFSQTWFRIQFYNDNCIQSYHCHPLGLCDTAHVSQKHVKTIPGKKWRSAS